MLNKFRYINIFYGIFFLFLSHTCLYAEKVNSIQIDGNDRVSDETVKIYGEININDFFDENKLDKIIKNLYSTEFFEEINVEIKNNKLVINLKEYPFVNQIILVGEKTKKIKEQIKKQIKLKEKRPFIKAYLSKDIDIIKKLYSSIGYNFSKIEVKLNQIDERNLDLLIEIDRGKETRISSIKFTGDKKVKEKRLMDIIASEENKFWKIISRNTKFSQNLISLDLRLLENYYKSLGYYDVQITSNTAEINQNENVDLIYSIEAGTRYTIKRIATNLDPIFDKKLFFQLNKTYNKYIGDYYSPFKIKKILETIDELIAKNNLQFIEHNVTEEIEGDTIVVKFNIFEGERTLVQRINVLGNNVTNEAVIRGELLLDEGDPFTNINLEKSISKIKARNIFQNVDYKVSDGDDPNLKVIDISIEEKATGEISAGAGIGTNGGSFGVSVNENNWLGKGNRIGFDLEVNAESLTGTINYTQPNYNFLGNSLNYFVSSTSNDKPDQGYENTLISSGISTSFEQYRDVFTNLGIKATYDDLRTQDSASASLKKQSGSFNELAGSYGFKYDKRNRAFMPTSGSVISFNQILPIYADKKFIDNTFATSTYKSFTEDIVGAGKFYITAINGLNNEDVRLSKRKNLSTGRLRGFEKGKVGPVDGSDHVGGNFATAINFEATLPNLLPENTKTDVSLFFDAGNVWGVDYDKSIDDSNKIRTSTGAAASWLSPLGPMTFILSTSLSKASTDETEAFNFNLGTTF